jgi:hypothetical protein
VTLHSFYMGGFHDTLRMEMEKESMPRILMCGDPAVRTSSRAPQHGIESGAEQASAGWIVPYQFSASAFWTIRAALSASFIPSAASCA